MESLKPIIAKNIIQLRTDAGLTQNELAQKLNYSDKSVSKWERAESVPDISVLLKIAELFGVTLDYLVKEEHTKAEESPATKNNRKNNYALITGISIQGVWTLAVVIYVLIHIIASAPKADWLPFVYAVPVSMIVWLVFNSIWFNRRRNYLIISLLMWSVLASIFVTLIVFGIDTSLILLWGIPGQLIIFMCTRFKFKSK